MKYDIVLCGVGGQGGISVSVIIAQAAMAEGLQVKQSEVHGMAQRGGEVLAHLRIADGPIASPTIPEGTARLLLAFEPMEALRYLPWLAPDASIVAASEPVLNIPNYPDIAAVLSELRGLPHCLVIDADAIAKEAGNARAANMVLVGAASRLLPFPPARLERAIEQTFARKGEAVVAANLKAFEHGRNANN
jgi:indolepyruvate ferredoxin oxidoreductase beta subunit